MDEATLLKGLDIIDESHKHAGHGGSHQDGETHFRIEIVASAFEGMNAVNRQRKVYELVADELKERVHALALSTKTPGEAA